MAALLALNARQTGAKPTKPSGVLADVDTCPGSIDFGGVGTVAIVATQWNVKDDPAGKVEVEDNKVIPNYLGRSYFADRCSPGQYNNREYLALQLLGRSMTFTVDLSEAGCGCNVALYLTSLHQNSGRSECKDFYCDANSVCGVACAEIDIMEANAFAFRTSLHSADDRWGLSLGYGGGGAGWNGARDWSMVQYGTDGECINTSKPFQVKSDFPINASGNLEAMVLTLFQSGQQCNLSLTLQGYDGNATTSKKGSRAGMLALEEALRAGMTPIASLWGADDMGWMDGEGEDHLGPCKSDSEMNCPQSVTMQDFYLEDLPATDRRLRGSLGESAKDL